MNRSLHSVLGGFITHMYYLFCCFSEVTIAFNKPVFAVREDNGPAEPVLQLSGPIHCCTVSVWVNINGINATGM